jgi:ubiquitin C-terminal hydrolase
MAPPVRVENWNASCYLTATVHCLLVVARRLRDVPKWLQEMQIGASRGQAVHGKDVVAKYTQAGGKHVGQGDPAEALDVFLDKMPSLASAVQGSIRHSSVCSRKGHVSLHTEAFRVLDIGANPNLSDASACFEHLCAPVDIPDHKCRECGVEEHGKEKIEEHKDPDKIITPGPSVHRRQIKSVSRFLILQVRRLVLGRKLKTPIEFQDFLTDDNGNKYTLQAIVVHHGIASGGHYTTYVNQDGQWWDCDDGNVSPCPLGYDARMVDTNGVLYVYSIN